MGIEKNGLQQFQMESYQPIKRLKNKMTRNWHCLCSLWGTN